MHQNSLYRKIYESDSNLNIGYDYKKDMLIYKWISPALLGNPRLKLFIDKINDIVVFFLDLMKYFQFYQNFTIDKNDKRYNI